MEPTLSTELLSAASEFVVTTLGLHFPQEKWTDLERGIASAAPELGHANPAACARWLLTGSLTRTEIEVLASYLTVGETYFFRERESLQVFEHEIVPELLRARGKDGRRLRIWSAGCCTGEEPYSIAMILDRLIPDPTDWNVTILGTDINPRFLRKAVEGIYGEWSFRGTPEPARERYFRKRDGGRYELRADIRSRVTFSHLNLAVDSYPSLLNNTNAMDVIFCRNVLMYFSLERTREVAERFHHALVPGGWLIVSATETSNALFASFSALQFSGMTLYRKSGGHEPKSFETSLAAPSAGEADRVRIAPRGPSSEAGIPAASTLAPPISDLPAAGAEPASEMAGEGSPPASYDSERLLARARSCANEGRLADAAGWCRRAVAADKMNPVVHYLTAIVQHETGEIAAAVESMQRVLYLAPGFVLAHFSLGNIELSRDRAKAAGRHFANTLAILRDHAPDEILPESDGLTAGRLAEIVTSVLASLPSAGKQPNGRSVRA